MLGRRLRYLTLMAGLGLFYLASGEWISWVLLIAAAALPWFSLLISIPAIWSFSLAPSGGGILEAGEHTRLLLMGSSRLPLPPFQGNIRMNSCFTGQAVPYDASKGIRPEHCGGWQLHVDGGRVFDYMGLFSFRIRDLQDGLLIVRPHPVPMTDAIRPEATDALSWRPKYGGGFAENHELREYRPGDNLNQVHWKLSAKTGSLIIREPMEPVRGTILVTMGLCGSPEELDRKLGRLLWLGRLLLENNTDFELRVQTGSGTNVFSVGSEHALTKALDTLLCTGTAPADTLAGTVFDAQWHCHIGGEADAL